MNLQQTVMVMEHLPLSEIALERRLAIEEEDTVAMEGIFSSIREGIGNIVNGARSDFALSSISDNQNIQLIKKLSSKLKGKTQLKQETPLIEINHYSKWLKIHGEVIHDGNRIIVELERILTLSRTFLNAYLPALEHLFHYTADTFLEKALVNEKKAARELSPNIKEFYPKQFDSVLTKRLIGVHKLVGESKAPVRASNVYLGNWFVASNTLDHPGYTNLLPVIVNVNDNPINGIEPRMYVLPYTSQQTARIMNLISEILALETSLTEWNNFKDSGNKIDRLCHQYEMMHANFEHYSEEQKVLVLEVIEIAQSVFREYKTLSFFANIVNRLSFVILQVCEGSIHRME